MGLLTESKARILKDAGVERINHNLNTSSRYHPEVVSTHTYDDRVATLESVKAAGLSTCCGGIIGLGEQNEDVMDLAVSLRELDVDSIPVNFLHAIPGTPMEARSNLTPQYCLKVLCLFRFVNPSKEIRVAGGREVNLRTLQPPEPVPGQLDFRQRLPDDVGPGRHRRPSDDRGSGFRDRDVRAGRAAGAAEYRVNGRRIRTGTISFRGAGVDARRGGFQTRPCPTPSERTTRPPRSAGAEAHRTGEYPWHELPSKIASTRLPTASSW